MHLVSLFIQTNYSSLWQLHLLWREKCGSGSASFSCEQVCGSFLSSLCTSLLLGAVVFVVAKLLIGGRSYLMFIVESAYYWSLRSVWQWCCTALSPSVVKIICKRLVQISCIAFVCSCRARTCFSPCFPTSSLNITCTKAVVRDTSPFFCLIISSLSLTLQVKLAKYP